MPCKKITLDKLEGRRRAVRPNLGWMEWWEMQRSWESGTGGLRPGTETVGGVFLSRPGPYMGCSAWESVSQSFE